MRYIPSGGMEAAITITWTKEWVIDDGIIDADHQVLIEIINQCAAIPREDLTKNAMKAVLLKLVRYAEMHFIREERLQEIVGFGLKFPHQQSHNRFVQALHDYQVKLAECTDENLCDFANDMDAFLTEWFEHHVLSEDMRMQPYVHEIRRKQREKMSLEELVRLRQAECEERAEKRAKQAQG